MSTPAVTNLFPGFIVPAYLNADKSIVLVTEDSNNLTCEEAFLYFYRIEASPDDNSITVESISISYINLGLVTLTVQVNSSYESRATTLTLGDPSQTKIYYGASPPVAMADNKIYIANFTFTPLTDINFQVSLKMAANAGPLAITMVKVFGSKGEEYTR